MEDQLTRDERIRLEALAQATVLGSCRPAATILFVVDTAKTFEKYIRGESSGQ